MKKFFNFLASLIVIVSVFMVSFLITSSLTITSSNKLFGLTIRNRFNTDQAIFYSLAITVLLIFIYKKIISPFVNKKSEEKKK
jgi:hypothetical protein